MRSLFFLFAACLFAACSSTAPLAADTPRFDDVQPVLAKLTPLLETEPGLDLTRWAGLLAGSEHGGVLIPFAPDRSLLVRWAEHDPASTLTPDEIARLRSWIAAGARSNEGRVAYADARNLLYVANQGEATVSVIDMDRNLVIRLVDLQTLGFGPNAKPHHVAVEPDGAHWYLSLIGENRVLKFNRANEVVAQAAFDVPGMLALDPMSDRLLVGRSMSAVNPPPSIGLVARSTMAVEELDVLFPRPHALNVAPNGAHAFVASLAQNDYAVVDLEREDVEIHRVPGGTHTFVQFAVSPDGETLAVGGQLSGKVLFFDLAGGLPVLSDSLTVNAAPWHPVYTPDGRFLYFGNKMAHTVTAVDARTRQLADVIEHPGIAQPHGSAVRPDGRYVYVSSSNLDNRYTPRYAWDRPIMKMDTKDAERDQPHGNHGGMGGMGGMQMSGDGTTPGTVVIIDTQTQHVVKVLEVGHYPTGIGTRSGGDA